MGNSGNKINCVSLIPIEKINLNLCENLPEVPPDPLYLKLYNSETKCLYQWNCVCKKWEICEYENYPVYLKYEKGENLYE